MKNTASTGSPERACVSASLLAGTDQPITAAVWPSGVPRTTCTTRWSGRRPSDIERFGGFGFGDVGVHDDGERRRITLVEEGARARRRARRAQ